VSGGEPERSGPKIYVSRAVSGSPKNERIGAWSGRSWSGERRSQKWALMRRAKEPAPLCSDAPIIHASYIFICSH